MLNTVLTDCDVLRSAAGDITPDYPNVAEPVISILVDHDQQTRAVKIAGELDLASWASVTRACAGNRARTVVVDLADLTVFCGGLAARSS